IHDHDLVDVDAPLTHELDPGIFGVQALEDAVDGGVDPSALRLEQLQFCEVPHLGYWLPEPGAERAPGEWLVCANIFDLVVQLVLGEREPRIAGLLAEVELP